MLKIHVKVWKLQESSPKLSIFQHDGPNIRSDNPSPSQRAKCVLPRNLTAGFSENDGFQVRKPSFST